MEPYRKPWRDLSTAAAPSWALLCRQAAGQKVTKFNGVWMTEDRARELRGKFPIHDLPYELRHRVLEFVADRSTIAVYLPGYYGAPTAIPLPRGVTQAGDKKLRLEAILVAIKQATLEIHSGPANEKLQKWLASLNFTPIVDSRLVSGFEAIHCLRFPYFSRYPHRSLLSSNPNNDIELMRRCKNLRQVQIEFVGSELWQKSVLKLRREYRFDRMRNLDALKTLVLKGPPGHAALVALAAWFRWEYAVQGRTDFSVKIVTGHGWE
ncbi:hypothetical protein LTR37_007078 [Vermiconidia calcicola]|uniref:Uncharacterized protein n=1 Tax=Vermiconidia calcicola TaxID=1690605 RepID=A0ACC3NG03_9PEZI|nr:hypothetical protein LTR37_007078 [Vermiconidia calcicola]